MNLNSLLLGVGLLCILCQFASGGQAEVAELTNRFSIDVYQKLNDQKGNLVFSPFSLAAILTFMWESAKEGSTTAKELLKALHYDQLEHEDIDEFYKKTLTSLTSATDIQLKVANAIWVKQGFSMKDHLVEHLGQTYFTTKEQFTADQAGKSKVNNWVKDKTSGKIDQILSTVPTNDVLMLIDAIYFKGSWARKFDPSKTLKKNFTQSDNTIRQIDVMRDNGKYGYTENSNINAKIVSIPYKGDKIKLMVFLPNEGSTLEQMENKLTVAIFNDIMKSLTDKTLDMYFPKFDLTSSFEDLVSTLKKLEISDSFTNKADFSTITDEKGVYVSKVVQKSRMEVNEEGTEASTGSVAEMSKMATAAASNQVFDVKKPFFFILHYIPTNTILFMGRFTRVDN